MAEPDLAIVAQQLSAKFLENGNYTFAGPLSGTSVMHVMPAAAQPGTVDTYFEEFGFAGLAVQSVGYERGRNDDLPPKVHVYVVKGTRKSEKDLAESVVGVPLQIDRIGRVIVRPEMAAGATNRGNIFLHKGRVACGSSCAPSGENYAGTMGALVAKDSRLYVLSNNHVIAACNHTPVGTPILAPANMDGRPGARAPGEISRHSLIAELRSGAPSLVDPLLEDAAIAEVFDRKLVSSWQGEDATGFDTPKKAIVPYSGLVVKKFGRTTGLTRGTVEAFINTPFAIPYKSRHFTATVWFRDMWTVRGEVGSSFALPGDSGSLVVDDAGQSAVGLVFAVGGSSEYGIMIPMKHILGLFGGVSLVSGHGV